MSQVPTSPQPSLSQPVQETPTEPTCLTRIRPRARRFALWMRYLWTQGLTSAEQGLAITSGEVDRLLLDPDAMARLEAQFEAESQPAQALQAQIEEADRGLEHDEIWNRLCACFGLSAPERDLLALSAAVELDPGLRRVFAYLHDDVGAIQATPWLAAKLFGWTTQEAIDPQGGLVTWKLVRPNETSRNPWSALTGWQVDPVVPMLLRHGVWRDPMLAGVLQHEPTEPVASVSSLHELTLEEAHDFVEAIRLGSEAAIEIELVGSPGIGKRTLARRLAAKFGCGLVSLDASVLLDANLDIARDRLLRAWRLVRATGAIAYWQVADEVPDAVWNVRVPRPTLTIVGRTHAASRPDGDGVVRHSIQLSSLTVC
jgi:hypothetical protein